MERTKIPTARDIMVTSVVTLRPDMPMLEAAGALLEHRISGAPVVDDQGRILGLVSEFDCLRAVASAEYEMDAHDVIESVGEIMSREPYTISPDMDLFAIAHEFVTRHVRRFPVVENDRLIGQVSRRDALAAAIAVRERMAHGRHRYPDYPEGRNPIRDYPRRSG